MAEVFRIMREQHSAICSEHNESVIDHVFAAVKDSTFHKLQAKLFTPEV